MEKRQALIAYECASENSRDNMRMKMKMLPVDARDKRGRY